MISWSPSEAASINEFLSSPLGMKWLGYLFDHKPRLELGDLKTQEYTALKGAFSAGYENVFTVIASSRTTPPQESVSAKSIDMTRD